MIVLATTQGFSSLADIIGDIGSIFDNLETILSTTGLAMALTPILFLIALCWNYVNAFLNSTAEKPQFFDAKELKRSIAILILIPFIPAIIGFVVFLGDFSASFFELSRKEEMENLGLIFEKVTDFKSLSFFNWNLRASAIICCYVTVFFFMIIKFAILMFTGAFQVFIIAVSPLAAAFSILPFLKDQLIKLIKIAMNVSFIGLTLNLLDKMFYAVITKKILGPGTDGLTNEFFTAFLITSVCFVIIIFYILCIWLTGQYVGDPSATAILGMATTVAATAAVLAVNAVGMAASAGGSSGGGGYVGGLGSDIARDIAKGITKDDNKK